MPLDDNQIAHLDRLVRDSSKVMRTNYRKGAEEHGGYLWDLSALALVDNAIEELADAQAYLLTVRDKIVSGLRD